MADHAPSDDAPSGSMALQRLKEELLRPPFHSFLRPLAVAAEEQTGEVIVRLPFRAEFSMDPEHAAYHGGIICALADLTAHAAVAVRIGRRAPTIDLRVDFLSMAPGVDLLARAIVLRAGRTVARADVAIYAADKQVAVARGTFGTAVP